MKPLTRVLFLLCACLSIVLGLVLPWVVTARLDRAAEVQVLSFDAPEISLNREVDLFRRLELAACDPSLVVLTNGMSKHTAEEIQTLAAEALDCLAGRGLTAFSSDRWSFTAVCQPLLATDTGYTMTYDGETQTWTSASNRALETNSAIVWRCVLSTVEGERLTLLLDDDLGLVLSFVYEGDLFGEKGSQTSVSLSDETAGRMGEFCREYYQLEDLQADAASDSSWLLTFFNADNEKCWVALSATTTSLFFNVSNDLHRSIDDSYFTDAFPSSN